MCEHTAPKGSPERDYLRNEGRRARRQGRAEGKLPATHKLRRRSGWRLAPGGVRQTRLDEARCEGESHIADRRRNDELILLRKISGGSQNAARLLAAAGIGSRM